MQLEVLDELPDGCDGIYGMFAGAGESVVNREIILLNDLLAKFKLFLTSLRGALEGRIHWNQTHDSAIKSIKDGGFFPEIWLGSFAHCYTQAGRRKAPISFWLNHMKQRVNYFNNILISQNFVGDVRLGYMLHPAFAIHSLVSDEHQCWGVCGVSTPAPARVNCIQWIVLGRRRIQKWLGFRDRKKRIVFVNEWYICNEREIKTPPRRKGNFTHARCM